MFPYDRTISVLLLICFKSFIILILINTHVNYSLQISILFYLWIVWYTEYHPCSNTEIFTIVIVCYTYYSLFQNMQTGEMIKCRSKKMMQCVMIHWYWKIGFRIHIYNTMITTSCWKSNDMSWFHVIYIHE